ncbi:MAG TPA: hypothetical protein P5141_05960 [Candidatus Hydrogenedentes bacterium]|nr:hypothetical protein [Candidatus Hydrogenedentota bacterium]HQL93565.1 hypothetical protein [Candidatus Hydrogenedentota bacterium]HRZ17090.1 hypothetical protein [Candidatus Hydrogenedentota bacterium]HRZ81486.1 hypothetical protein [Candidatus Hydrogenedentota bacterium]
MRHVAMLTRTRAVPKATALEDTICAVSAVLSALLGFFGGSSPVLLFVEDKCAIPTPGTNTGSGS